MSFSFSPIYRRASLGWVGALVVDAAAAASGVAEERPRGGGDGMGLRGVRRAVPCARWTRDDDGGLFRCSPFLASCDGGRVFLSSAEKEKTNWGLGGRFREAGHTTNTGLVGPGWSVGARPRAK